MREATGTPQGLTLNSRGQGHAFCARRPRIAPRPIFPTLTGSNGSAPGQVARPFLANFALDKPTPWGLCST